MPGSQPYTVITLESFAKAGGAEKAVCVIVTVDWVPPDGFVPLELNRARPGRSEALPFSISLRIKHAALIFQTLTAGRGLSTSSPSHGGHVIIG